MSSVNNDDQLQVMQVPIIDISLLGKDSDTKSAITKKIHEACLGTGIFQVVNHGIPNLVIAEAFSVALNFFELPWKVKEEFKRIGSTVEGRQVSLATYGHEAQGCGQFQKEILRLYANPLEDFEGLWPRNPPNYREKMGLYAKEMRKLAIKLFGAIMDCLNLEATDLKEKFDQGMQIDGINIFRPCFHQDIRVAGSAPHADHSIITLLHTNSPGFHVIDMDDGSWKAIPELEGSIKVLIGNHLEVLSNGAYKSLWHGVRPSFKENRLSVVSFFNFGMDEIAEPASELIDEKHPKKYKGSTTRDFLKHIITRNSTSFIETLKI